MSFRREQQNKNGGKLERDTRAAIEPYWASFNLGRVVYRAFCLRRRRWIVRSCCTAVTAAPCALDTTRHRNATAVPKRRCRVDRNLGSRIYQRDVVSMATIRGRGCDLGRRCVRERRDADATSRGPD